MAGRSKLVTNVSNNFIKTSQHMSRNFASKDNFLNGGNANYVDYMYDCWQHDPSSVNASWNAYFATGDFDTPSTLGMTARDAQLDEILKILKSGGGVQASGEAAGSAEDSVRLYKICRAYQAYGHLIADTDPLNLKSHYKDMDAMK